MLDYQLKDKLLATIAAAYPFPLEDVRIAYNVVGSFDAVIRVCQAAVQMGDSDIIHRAQIMNRRQFGPSETK